MTLVREPHALGAGLGLRPAFLSRLKAAASQTDSLGGPKWLEAVTENFLGIKPRTLSPRVDNLSELSKHFPLALHGVALNLGSADPIDPGYLESLRELDDRLKPAIISDHLCWSAINGRALHDLIPLPYTREVAAWVAGRIQRVQDLLGRRILIENVSSYIDYAQSTMPEWEFLSLVVDRADCGILLDVNNVYVNSVNHGFDPMSYIRGIPVDRVGQIHLGGHVERPIHGRSFLIDTHGAPVAEQVWALYGKTLEVTGAITTCIERDSNIPTYDEILVEVARVQDYLDTAAQPAFRVSRERRQALASQPSRPSALV